MVHCSPFAVRGSQWGFCGTRFGGQPLSRFLTPALSQSSSALFRVFICVDLRSSAVVLSSFFLFASIRSLPRRRLGEGGSIRGRSLVFASIRGPYLSERARELSWTHGKRANYWRKPRHWLRLSKSISRHRFQGFCWVPENGEHGQSGKIGSVTRRSSAGTTSRCQL